MMCCLGFKIALFSFGSIATVTSGDQAKSESSFGGREWLAAYNVLVGYFSIEIVFNKLYHDLYAQLEGKKGLVILHCV